MKIYEENLNFDHTNYSFIHSFNTQIKREFTEYYDFISGLVLKVISQCFKTKRNSLGETLSFK